MRSPGRATRLQRHSLLLGLMVLLGGASSASAEPVVSWFSDTAGLESRLEQPCVCYQGLAGSVVEADVAPGVLESLGGRTIDLGADETLYVYLVEDAESAEFLPPARVLLRDGHEVLLATGGETPVPTEETRRSQSGLQQPIRVSRTPLTRAVSAATPPARVREADPLIQQMMDQLTSASYMSTWHTLEDFVTRYTFAPQNELATQWVLDQFLSMGLDAEFHYYSQSGQRRNVVATLPGVAHPDEIVYICSHIDATSPTPDVCAPGADDNGSGSATVVEAARVLSQYVFERTIKFVCFNGEEQGLVGSSAYAADMAAQGENIVGVYDIDMIAYRGTDAAPADLVIYTDSPSQGLASTVSDVIQTYLPTQLEPVVHVEAMGGSDHASFWTYGFPAICSIEDEAWGSDFCPWYHTCDDQISRYPEDYVLNCAKAELASVSLTAVPITPDGPYLVLNDTLVDDDDSGSSHGDGDGEVNPGETIELWATLGNVGTVAATGVSGEITSQTGHVTIVTATASWNDIPAQGQGMNLTPLVFQVAGEAADGEMLPLTLTVTDDAGSQPLAMQFPVVAPDLAYYFHRLQDGVTGNGNGVLDPGEVVELPVSLFNGGGRDAQSVTAQMICFDPDLTVTAGEAGVGLIAEGEHAELAPAYRVRVSHDATVGQTFVLSLAIGAGVGYQSGSSFEIKVGSAFFDDLEADGAWSLAAPDDDATTGRWVRVDPIGTEYESLPVQPEDDHTPAPGTDCFVTGQGAPGGAAGDADVDGGKTTLTTPIFDIATVDQPQVSYWRWYTNDRGNYPSEDWWVVQVSSDGGGSWIDLERTQQSDASWTNHTFDLTSYIVPSDQVVFRFVASDEDGGSLVEAAVDDFEILGQVAPVAVDEGAAPLVLQLFPARPSPVMDGTELSFALPITGKAALEIFSVDGRLVRSLAGGTFEAGIHRVPWDARSNGGRRVAPGVYFCRLTTEQRSLTRSLVIVR